METPQRVLPVIDYETPRASPLRPVLRMVGWIAIAMGVVWLLVLVGAILHVLGIYFGPWSSTRPYFGIFALADLVAAITLLVGGGACLRYRRWGKVLLLFIACLHPVARGIESFVSLTLLNIPDGLDYSYQFFLWLPSAAFPLLAFVLLLRRDIGSAFVSRDGVRHDMTYGMREQATRPPLCAANSALCCLAILYGGVLGLLLAHILSRLGSGWNPDLIPVVLLAILLAGSVGCLFFQRWARMLLLLFAIFCPLLFLGRPVFWLIGSWSLRRLLTIADAILQPAPFTLVILMFYLNRDVRALFSRRRDGGAA